MRRIFRETNKFADALANDSTINTNAVNEYLRDSLEKVGNALMRLFDNRIHFFNLVGVYAKSTTFVHN